MEENKTVDQPHSVKLSINAKLQYSAEIKCYANAPEEALKKTTEIAKQVEALIKIKNSI